jgi:succinoglycan biosynthesis transport protein ExoP
MDVTEERQGNSVGTSSPDERTERPAELRHYLAVLARQKLLIAVVVGVAVVAAIALTTLPAARWTGTATLRVEPGTAASGGVVRADDLEYLDRLINTYAKVVSNGAFADALAEKLRLDEAPTLELEGVPSTNLVEIHATTPDRAVSAKAANAAATALIQNVRRAAAADSRAAETAFRRRAERLETDLARARAELEELRGTVQSPATRVRALQLTEEINGMRLSLTALHDGYQASQPARDARASSLSLSIPASPPSQPDGGNVALAVALALALGLVGGAGLAFLRENLSRRFRSADEIEASVRAPVLAAIPEVRGSVASPLFNGASPAQEGFRRLRTALLTRYEDGLLTRYEDRPLMVASARPGDGRSTVVANLGVSLAQAGRSVVVVDADLRAPDLHRILGVPRAPGLGDMLSGLSGADPERAPLACRPTGMAEISILPAGSVVDDPATLLGSDAMGLVVDELERHFDCVLIDSSAILAVADALALVRHVPSVVLVAASGTSRDELWLADQELRRSQASVVGVVINRASDSGLYPYAGYGASHSDRELLDPGIGSFLRMGG